MYAYINKHFSVNVEKSLFPCPWLLVHFHLEGLTLECTSDSPGGLVKTDGWARSPKFPTQSVQGGA